MSTIISAPFNSGDLARLSAGDFVIIRGPLYVARDEAHRRLYELIRKQKELPVQLNCQGIFYAGPTPARPGNPIGAIGPTTSSRMDPYTPAILAAGAKVLLGKGPRSPKVREALLSHGAVYLAVTGGVAALLARTVRRARVVAYRELGPEALLEIEVDGLPAIVVNDLHGQDLYEIARGEGNKK